MCLLSRLLCLHPPVSGKSQKCVLRSHELLNCVCVCAVICGNVSSLRWKESFWEIAVLAIILIKRRHLKTTIFYSITSHTCSWFWLYESFSFYFKQIDGTWKVVLTIHRLIRHNQRQTETAVFVLYPEAAVTNPHMNRWKGYGRICLCGILLASAKPVYVYQISFIQHEPCLGTVKNMWPEWFSWILVNGSWRSICGKNTITCCTRPALPFPVLLVWKNRSTHTWPVICQHY